MEESNGAVRDDGISRLELRRLLGAQEAERIFTMYRTAQLMGKVKPLTVPELESAERLMLGHAEPGPRDHIRTGTVTRMYFATHARPRKLLLQWIDQVKKDMEPARTTKKRGKK